MADSGYFEIEEVVKEYDSKIAARIFSYLKPYKLLAIITLASLAFSTLGELLVPILQQRLIDRAIMSRYLLLMPNDSQNLGAETRRTLDELISTNGTITINSKQPEGFYVYVPWDEKLRISSRAERELTSFGILNTSRWYAFIFPEDPLARASVNTLMEQYPQIFVRGNNAAALTIENLTLLSPDEKQIIRFRDISRITTTVLIILAVLIAVFAFTFIQTWTSSLIGQKVMKDIRLELFKKTGEQSTAFLSRHPVGRIVTRLTGDVETLNGFFTEVLIAFLKDISIMTGALITLFILSPRLAGITLLTLPPVLVVTAFSRVRARDAFRQQRAASSGLNSYLSERLSGIQVVQLFLGERRSRKEFGMRNRDFFKANMAEMYVYAIFRPIIDFLSTFTTATVIAMGAIFVLNLSLSLGVLIAFINLVGLFYAPVMDIAEKYTLLQSAMAGGERVFALLDTDEKIPDKGTQNIESENRNTEGEVKSSILRGHIDFNEVNFTYKEGEEVLKNVSFTVKPGEMAAIVGYTGAGKTTIINVLTRLWDIQKGTISLDGIPIQNIPLSQLRRQVLPVLQEVFLFSGTVAENISLGLPIERDLIIQAAKTVHADEFISALPEAYDTILSEGASNISSGQRQLISFARVIAHNPAIVILDEATSSIDTETERLIQLGIQQVLSDRTSIVIAHRLSTIRHADRILVLSGGTLVEEGRHDELISLGGLYAGLYNLQFSASY